MDSLFLFCSNLTHIFATPNRKIINLWSVLYSNLSRTTTFVKLLINQTKLRSKSDYTTTTTALVKKLFWRKDFFLCFFGVPYLSTFISLFSVNQDWCLQELIFFTPFPCSIWKRWDSNPLPFDREPSWLTTTPSSHSGGQSYNPGRHGPKN